MSDLAAELAELSGLPLDALLVLSERELRQVSLSAIAAFRSDVNVQPKDVQRKDPPSRSKGRMTSRRVNKET